MKHRNEIEKFVRDGDYCDTPEGLLIHGGLMARGNYYHTVNGEDEQKDSNLIVAQGILHILNVVLGDTTRNTVWYLAPYSGNWTPEPDTTAANFHGRAVEIGTGPPGYSEGNRPLWNKTAASNGQISNLNSRAVFTIQTATTVVIYGAGLLSLPTKQTVNGTLISATRFANSRTLYDTDTFELGYEIELTDS